MKRRDFLKNSFLASTLAATGYGCASTGPGSSAKTPEKSVRQEYYELRAYRLKPGADGKVVHAYLEKALIPALNRVGSIPVGVFVEIEPKDPATVFVLAPFPDLESYGALGRRLGGDQGYQQAAGEYLATPKSQPAYDRIDSWLLRAFAGMPRLELPSFSQAGKPRIFEMRTYESHNETKARKKVDMFNNGEIDLMRELGLSPVFYGEGVTGPNLPHLTYMTSATDEALHKQHWDAFGKHPKWDQMKNDPQYADTVSKITKWFLKPAPYSQI